MAYIIIICTARWYNEKEKEFFDEVDEELRKQSDYFYIIDKDHKHIILLSYESSLSSTILVEKMIPSIKILKDLEKKYDGFVRIDICGEAISL